MLFVHVNIVERRTNRVRDDSFKKLRKMGEDSNRTIVRDNFQITRFQERSNGTNNFESSEKHTRVVKFTK